MKKRSRILTKCPAIFLSAFLLASCGEKKPTPASSANSSSKETSVSSQVTPSQTSEKGSSESLPPQPKEATFAFASTYDPSKTYDGQPVSVPTAADWTTDSDGEPTITFFSGETALESAPIDAGSYIVKVDLSATENFLATSESKEFTIFQADPGLAFVDGYSLDSVYTGNAVVAPTSENYTSLSDGAITYAFYQGETLLEEAPSEVGFYRLLLNQEATKNYLADSAELPFTISKATPAALAFPEGYAPGKVYDGQPAASPEVADGVSVSFYQGTTKLASAPSDPGSYSVEIAKAEDEHYLATSAKMDFTISPYLTNVFQGHSGLAMKLTFDEESGADQSIKKDDDGKMILQGSGWVKLNFAGIEIPQNADAIVLKAKANEAIDSLAYRAYGSSGSIAEGNIAMGMKSKDIVLELKANTTFESLAFQLQSKTLTIESISVRAVSLAAGYTNIFNPGEDIQTPVDVNSASTFTLENAARNELHIGVNGSGGWWRMVDVNGTTGYSIPTGMNTVTMLIRSNQYSGSASYRFAIDGTNHEGTFQAVAGEYVAVSYSFSSGTALTGFGVDGSGGWDYYVKSILFSYVINYSKVTIDGTAVDCLAYGDSQISNQADGTLALVNGAGTYWNFGFTLREAITIPTDAKTMTIVANGGYDYGYANTWRLCRGDSVLLEKGWTNALKTANSTESFNVSSLAGQQFDGMHFAVNGYNVNIVSIAFSA